MRCIEYKNECCKLQGSLKKSKYICRNRDVFANWLKRMGSYVGLRHVGVSNMS